MPPQSTTTRNGRTATRTVKVESVPSTTATTRPPRGQRLVKDFHNTIIVGSVYPLTCASHHSSNYMPAGEVERNRCRVCVPDRQGGSGVIVRAGGLAATRHEDRFLPPMLNGRCPRIFLLPVHPGECRFTQLIAVVQAWRPELVFMPLLRHSRPHRRTAG